MRAWPIAAVVAVTAGLVGPRVLARQSHEAKEPFAYAPPEGFVERSVPSVEAGTSGARAWELPSNEIKGGPVVSVHHSTVRMQVDERSLGEMASDMPKAFEDCAWSHRRHETRLRADGASVGLIEGDCTREVNLGIAASPTTAKVRKLQLVFPDNDGTSIATISYAADQAARWEPAFEATIDGARGVATRVPPPPLWEHGAWGAAGLVLGGLAAALASGKKDEEKDAT